MFSSLCIPLHPGLYYGLHWDPTGGEWKSCVYGSGPRAAAGCVTGQCPLYEPRVLIFVSLIHIAYILSYRTAIGRLLSDCEFFSMFFNVPTLHYWSGCRSSRSLINLYYPGGKYGWQSPWLQSNNTHINHKERWFKQTTWQKRTYIFTLSSCFSTYSQTSILFHRLQWAQPPTAVPETPVPRVPHRRPPAMRCPCSPRRSVTVSPAQLKRRRWLI